MQFWAGDLAFHFSETTVYLRHFSFRKSMMDGSPPKTNVVDTFFTSCNAIKSTAKLFSLKTSTNTKIPNWIDGYVADDDTKAML